jgi:hypothetical protein
VNLDESDEFGSFVFRTTGFNSIRTLTARLSYYHAASNGLLSCLPLQLTLRGKSTTQSYRTPVYYVDLILRDGVHLQEAIQTAKEIDQKSKLCGFNQAALDQMARQGYGNARFEVDGEEGLDLVEEFYANEASEEEHQQIVHVQTESKARAKSKPKFNQGENPVQDIQQGLIQSVQVLN